MTSPGTHVVTDPRAVVEEVFDAFVASDLDRAAPYLADDIVYSNVGLPTIHGARRTLAVFRVFDRPGVRFEAYFHAISADGPTVLTERTDVIVLGPVRLQFWVAGRFDVVDGKIVLWRDAFDFWDMTRGTVRGLVGAVVPALRPKPPADPRRTPPGR